jgi:Mg/Co/Ni transporter MgtE
MVIRGQFSGLWLAFIGWFLENAATQSYRQTALREALRGVTAGDIMNQECAYVPDDLTIDSFVHSYVLPQSRRCFLLTDKGQLTGMVTLHNVKEVPKARWGETSIGEIMTPLDSVRRVQVTDDAFAVLSLIDSEDLNQVPVMDGEHLVGLISRDNVIRFIRTRSELGV